jgi:hypothetical protein
MANFRTTADYVTSILQLAGEEPSSTSAYQAKALEHLNSIQKTIISGGSEFNVEVDEVWDWARTARPFQLELLPPIEGTLTVAKGSPNITFTTAPQDDNNSNISLNNWFIKFKEKNTVYQVGSHVSGATAAELMGAVVETSGSYSFTAYKLEYDLIPNFITIQTGVNDIIDFTETTALTQISATLTAGTYTPSELASEVKIQMDAAGASTYSVTYSDITKLFTIASDRSGADGVFRLLGEAGTNTRRSALPLLGHGFTNTEDAASIVSTHIRSPIARLIQPIKLYSDQAEYSQIFSMDPIAFDREFPIHKANKVNPHYFKITKRTDRGEFRVQFNDYPTERRVIEIEYIPLPLDMYNNNASFPLIPNQHSKVLEYGAVAWLLFEKEDSKWERYYQLAAEKLRSMMTNNRKEDTRLGKNFGQVVAREDLVPRRRRLLRYGYTADGGY